MPGQQQAGRSVPFKTKQRKQKSVRFAYGAALQVLYLLFFMLSDLQKSNDNWTK